MNIIEYLYNFFDTCPLLENNFINVDYLPSNTKNGVEFSIDATPAEDVVVRYLDGSAICQSVFVLRSVNNYSQDVWINLENGGFYEDLSNWIREQSRKHQLPVIDDKKKALSMEVVSTVYISEKESDVGKYQIQCNFKYYRKA